MKKNIFYRNPYLLFFPFLIIFIIYILVFSPADLTAGDPARYLQYAQNLINGFYSPPTPGINLINGPGYPIIIIPFLLLKLPLISIALMNAFFYYFSIIFLYKSLKEVISHPATLVFSFAWACYIIAYQCMPFILTETFTYLLVTMLIYTCVKAFQKKINHKVNKYTIFSGVLLGYIVLTKMIFGYVLLFMLVGGVILWIVNKNSQNSRKSLTILLIAFLITTPYLLYTYHLTGRILYWGTGSNNLYWMSTPHKGEYGDWTSGLGQNSTEISNYNIKGADSVLRGNHQKDFNEILKFKGLEQDDVYKRLSFRNIESHPFKYLQNILYNMGRLVFHYPFSYAKQQPKILLIFPFHGILVTFILFSIIPTFINWRLMPYSLKFLLILIFLYFGASLLVSALVRMFTIIVPILLIWIAYIIQNTIKINLTIKNKTF